MLKILAIFILIILFLLLSKSADLIVLNLRKMGEKLGINIFFLGIVLGIITSLPELAIGINSVVNDVPNISFGHLMGGIIVLLGLILPISIILNRKIITEKKSLPFLATLIFLFLPLPIGFFRGYFDFFSGVFLMLSYVFLIFYLYKNNKNNNGTAVKIISEEKVKKNIVLIIAGLVGIMISSELIVKTTLFVLNGYDISLFAVGLLFYSLGTNLPELTIALRSFKRKVVELSFSNLIGAAMAHVLILGGLSSLKNINIEIDLSFIFLMTFSFIFFAMLYLFYRTGRLLSRLEACFLLTMYLIFISGQVFIQIYY